MCSINWIAQKFALPHSHPPNMYLYRSATCAARFRQFSHLNRRNFVKFSLKIHGLAIVAAVSASKCHSALNPPWKASASAPAAMCEKFQGGFMGRGAMGCSSNGISKQVTPFCNYICKISTWAWLSGLFYLKLPWVMPKMWEKTLGKFLWF